MPGPFRKTVFFGRVLRRIENDTTKDVLLSLSTFVFSLVFTYIFTNRLLITQNTKLH